MKTEDEINAWLDDLTEQNTRHKEIPKKSPFIEWFEDLKFNIEYWVNYNILSGLRNFRTGIYNLIKYRSIIWNDRWWDYSFMLEILLFKLKDMESNWGANTHYVNDLEDKDTLKKMIVDLEWMLNEEYSLEDGYSEKYKKVSTRFFGRLDRNHLKLWD
jgi:hypothetical protein